MFVEERGQIRPATREERDRRDSDQGRTWRHDAANAGMFVCALDDILDGTGVGALIDGRQIALFRVGGAVYALDNYDPDSGANVLSRGIVGDLQGELVVASPVYKHHFSLTHRPLPRRIRRSMRTAYPARVVDGRVQVRGARTRVKTTPAGRRRQRHGRHAHRRGAAGSAAPDMLRHHGLRRRAARQLQPHPAVAGAGRRDGAPTRSCCIAPSGTPSTASRCTPAIRSSRSTASNAA